MKRPLLIGIGASHSGSGKTTLAASILRYLSSSSREPGRSWGAIKYTRTPSPAELVTDPALLALPRKDTGRLLSAGASEVLWVRSNRDGLGKALTEAVERLSRCDAVVVEGNSAIEFLNPDIVLFIFGKGRERWKPGSERLASRADIICADDDVQLPAGIQPEKRFPGWLSEDGPEELLSALARMIYERRAETGDAETGG